MNRFLLLLLPLLLTVTRPNAQPVLGADLGFRNISGHDYEITLKIYLDCDYMIFPTVAQVYFVCASAAQYNFSAQLSPLAQPVLISNHCPAMPGSCTNTSPYKGIKEGVYSTVVTLPSCSNWRMYWTSSSQRQGSHVLTNPSSSVIYIESTFNSQLASNNSSPVFTNPPFFFLSNGQAFTFNHGVIDPDGDSLSYEFINPRSSVTTELNWIPPYNASQPFNSTPPVSLDPVTGTIKANPLVTMVPFGSNNVLKVTEWRKINGVPQIIGMVMRDISLQINGYTNQLPVLSGFDSVPPSNPPTSGIYDLIWCWPNPILMNICGYDPDTFNAAVPGSPEKFSISWNNGIPGATFTVNQNGSSMAWAEFNWIPTLADVRPEPYSFTATVKDEACPYNGYQTYLYRIFLKGDSLIKILGAPDTLCLNQTAVLSVSPGYTVLYWTNMDTGQTFTFDASVYGPGLYTIFVLGSDKYFCLSGDYVTIYVSPCTGIDETNEIREFLVYPNPVHESLTLKISGWKGAFSIDLIGSLGQVLSSERVYSNGFFIREMDLQKLPPGIYVLQISNESMTESRVLLVE